MGIGDDNLPLEEHKKSAKEGLRYARNEADSKKWNIIILDEIWNALELRLLTLEVVQDFIDMYVFKLEHLIMTGRNCPKEFVDQANLVTEMKEIKHPFSKGLAGRRGLEY